MFSVNFDTLDRAEIFNYLNNNENIPNVRVYISNDIARKEIYLDFAVAKNVSFRSRRRCEEVKSEVANVWRVWPMETMRDVRPEETGKPESSFIARWLVDAWSDMQKLPRFATLSTHESFASQRSNDV